MTPLISSFQNPRVKQLRALRTRKERERSGLFLLTGLQLVTAALQHHIAIERLIIAPELFAARRGAGGLRLPENVERLEVSAEIFESLAEKENAHGIAAVVRQRWHALEALCPSQGRCLVALEGTQYPGNLGTILRTADAVASSGVILIGPTADPYDPLAVRASTSAILTQPLARASPSQFADWKRRRAIALIGTSPGAPADYRAISYDRPVVLAFGSEGAGLSPAMQSLCDTLVHIPMAGRSDSLNLAIAAALVLYEAFRQQPAEQAHAVT
jgi:TrmH family RNA methyltransferase